MSEHEDESAPATWTFPLLCCTVKKDVQGMSFTINPLNMKFFCAKLEELNKWVSALGKTLKRDIEKYYKIGTTIGEGRNGVVKLATDLRTKEEVVVKITNLSAAQASQLVNLMVDVLILFSVQHHNIVRPLDFFESESKVFLVAEHLRGGTIESNILDMGERVPEEVVRDVMYRLLGAVKALHEINIVHCDIKIDNIVCANSKLPFEPKLIDLGSGMHEDSIRASGCSGGAPFYLAPEQVARKDCNRAVDLWACGIVMYWLTTRRHPFESDSPSEIMQKINSGEVDYGTEWGDYSLEMKQLLERLLEPDAGKRVTAADALNHPWFMGIAAKSTDEKVSHQTGLFGPSALLLQTLRPGTLGEDISQISSARSSLKSQPSFVTRMSSKEEVSVSKETDTFRPKSSPNMLDQIFAQSGPGLHESSKSKSAEIPFGSRVSIDSSTPEVPLTRKVLSRMRRAIIGEVPIRFR